MKLAVTGSTGFVGSRLLELALAAGHPIRALTRRPQGPREGVTWIDGALDRPDSLDALCEGADAVIHVAGVINAPDAAGFEAGNVTGTAAMLAAAKQAGVRRFVHVSSLAAREPELSQYGASKARSEALVRASGLPFAIVRPPAVYGPGDKEMLELFRMARRGIVLLPPGGRLSVIHADDLARLLLGLAGPEAPSGLVIEPDDGRPNGWSHGEFGQALGRAVGRRVATFSTPRPILDLGARIDRIVRRGRAKLTADRVAYFCHPDWTVDPARGVAQALWRATIDTEDGLSDTVSWYRAQGWL
ncbi:MAG TPA: NAD-dependent epimerase/dehydratase family protein [Sphingomicrobium sp.]|nr:NAD-dependent epimerase/dehydratase family protein [Sphingomicrobium sp.]